MTTLLVPASNVVVTGGASSVGRVIVERFAGAGSRVYVADVDEAALQDVIATHPDIRGTCTDVGEATQIDRLFADAAAWLGHVDVLVNVVGIGGPQAAIEEVDDEAWEETLRVNVGGAFRCIRHVVPGMKARRSGVIINFSSASTRTGLPLRTPYVVSKCALEGLTRNLARELGPFNIRCNAILPGMINNQRMRRIVAEKAALRGVCAEELRDEYLRYISMRSTVEPQELADMVCFLASSAGRHVSGQLIGVCGNVEWEA